MVNVAGVTSFPVGTKTEVKWGNSRLRVALVLDTTGSMSSAGKIDALKTAAKNLIDQLKAAASAPEDVYISIVPFVKDSNFGMIGSFDTAIELNYANWLDFTCWSQEPLTCGDPPLPIAHSRARSATGSPITPEPRVAPEPGARPCPGPPAPSPLGASASSAIIVQEP